MNYVDKKALCASIAASLRFVVADCNVSEIVDSLLDDVASYIDGLPQSDYGTDDVKLAVGHVLCERLKQH